MIVRGYKLSRPGQIAQYIKNVVAAENTATPGGYHWLRVIFTDYGIVFSARLGCRRCECTLSWEALLCDYGNPIMIALDQLVYKLKKG